MGGVVERRESEAMGGVVERRESEAMGGVVERRESEVLVGHAARAPRWLVRASGDVVLGIGAMGSRETATRPSVDDRPDARAVGFAVTEKPAREAPGG